MNSLAAAFGIGDVAEGLRRDKIEKVEARDARVVRLVVNLPRGKIQGRQMRRVHRYVAAKKFTDHVQVRSQSKVLLAIIGSDQKAAGSTSRIENGDIGPADTEAV